jgi:hypothetical protein
MLMLSLALLSPVVEPVDLSRVFKMGEKATYSFSSRINVDWRQVPIETFIPQNDGFEYTFTTEVEALKPDGVADLRFRRPKIVLKIGETFDSPPKEQILARDQNYLFVLSNKNRLLSVRDDSPKQPQKPDSRLFSHLYADEDRRLQLDIFSWMSQLRQLAAFVNFFDRGPNLPTRPVSVGDTWKETIGYVPTTVSAGADQGKNLMARLDYEYTYKGLIEFEGQTVYHVVGKIFQDTDAAPFIADLMGVKLEFAPFKEIKLKMDGTVDYYLRQSDLSVHKILAKSEGYTSITVATYEGGPVYEEKFKSNARLIRQ